MRMLRARSLKGCVSGTLSRALLAALISPTGPQKPLCLSRLRRVGFDRILEWLGQTEGDRAG